MCASRLCGLRAGMQQDAFADEDAHTAALVASLADPTFMGQATQQTRLTVAVLKHGMSATLKTSEYLSMCISSTLRELVCALTGSTL